MASSSPLFCIHCGAANQQQASFCFACGQPLQRSEAVGSSSSGTTDHLAPDHLLKDRYRIISQLGQGGMGAVYKAKDTLFNNRLVAVKEMSQSGLNTQQRVSAADDFKREAHMLADLHHPGLPIIYDYFSDSGQWYLVMDFIAGETLEEHLAHTNDGWLPIKQALSIGKQLCTVLEYLHTRQPPIIFRDLKPANVMCTASERVFLIDFGIARHFKPGQLKDTVSFGSAGYAAPEQYGKTQTTPRSDIYSLGVILHQCLTGNDPANNNPTTFNFPPLNLHGQVAPRDLSPLITLMLEMNPNNRPASMSSIYRILDRIETDLAAIERAAVIRASTTPSTLATLISASQPAPATPSQPASTPQPASTTPSKTPSTSQPTPAAVPQAAPKVAPKPQTPPPLKPYIVPPKPTAQSKTTTYNVQYHQAGIVHTLAWSPDGKRIALGDSSGHVHIWNAANMQPIYTYRNYSDVVHALAWSPDGTYLALGDKNGLLEVWRASNGERIYTYRGYSVEVKSIAWSPDSQRIASGDSQGRILVQDARNGEHSYTYRGPASRIEAVSWSPDGKHLAAGNSTGSVQIWDSSTHNLVFTYTRHAAKVNALAYSPDNKRIASADNDGRVHVWEPSEHGFSYIYRGHFGEVVAVVWSPDSQRIASGGADATVQVWDAIDGSHVFTYREQTERLTALAWSPNNSQRIVSASAGKTIHLWQAK